MLVLNEQIEYLKIIIKGFIKHVILQVYIPSILDKNTCMRISMS
jgi:hypothetical protein